MKTKDYNMILLREENSLSPSVHPIYNCLQSKKEPKQFEGTFEHAHRRKAKQMQPVHYGSGNGNRRIESSEK